MICRKELGMLLLYIFLGFLVLIPIVILYLVVIVVTQHLDADSFTKPVVFHFLMYAQAVFVMFIPAYLWCKKRLRRDPLKCYGFRKVDYRWILMACCACIAFFGAMDPINTFIYNLEFPAAMQEYINTSKVEDFAMSQALMNLPGVWGFLECVLLASIVTGIVEETLFRGAFLKCFGLSTLSPHVVVIIVGVLFSCVHFEILGFLDRAIFGIFACYLVYWSGSLWPAIALHALNNFMCILQFKYMPTDFDPLSPQEPAVPWYVSLAALVALYFLIRKMYDMREVRW